MLTEIFEFIETVRTLLGRHARKISIKAVKERVSVEEAAVIYGRANGLLWAPFKNRYLFAFVDGEVVDGVRMDEAGDFVYSRRLGPGFHSIFCMCLGQNLGKGRNLLRIRK